VLDGHLMEVTAKEEQSTLDRMAKRWPWPFCRDLTSIIYLISAIRTLITGSCLIEAR